SPSHAQGSVTDVKVMTYNIDEGTDFGPILAARSFNDLLTAVAQTYNEVQASNFAERSAGFAIKVESTQPDFIALQELSTWRTGPLNQPPATNVQLDHLQSILQALASRGLSYTPIAVQTNLDAEAPSALGFDVRLTDYDAVLVRTTPAFPRRTALATPIKVTNIQAQLFATNLSFTSPLLGPFTVPRGWISVDAMTNGKPFRFVTTHLESFSPLVRLAQAQELIAGPLNTTRPLIVAADLNSD